MEQYDSHDLFRADNCEAMEIRKKSSVGAMEDAALWLKEEGNVAVRKHATNLIVVQCNSCDIFLQR